MSILNNSFPPTLYYYYISSKDRIVPLDQSSSTANFRVQGINCYHPAKIILKSIRFPKTFYVVNDNNNKLSFSDGYNPALGIDGQTNVLTATFINGHYNEESFCVEVTRALNAAFFAAYATTPFNSTYVDEVTSEVCIANETGITSVFYNYPHYQTTCNTLIGFDDKLPARGIGFPGSGGIQNVTIPPIGGDVYDETRFGNTINLAGATSLFLCSDYLASRSTIRSTNPSISNAVAVIPVGDWGYGDIVNSIVDHVYDWHDNGTIDFRLLDDTGKQINLNGGDVEITLILIPEIK